MAATCRARRARSRPAAAIEELLVETRREHQRRLVTDGPVRADEVGDAAAEECLGHAVERGMRTGPLPVPGGSGARAAASQALKNTSAGRLPSPSRSEPRKTSRPAQTSPLLPDRLPRRSRARRSAARRAGPRRTPAAARSAWQPRLTAVRRLLPRRAACGSRLPLRPPLPAGRASDRRPPAPAGVLPGARCSFQCATVRVSLA